MSSLKCDACVVDPQYDFMGYTDGSPYEIRFADGTVYKATLPVPGADDDMKRLAVMIRRISRKLNDVHVTLDSHRPIDVAHPSMWRNKAGRNPEPFTIITSQDIKDGKWLPRNQSFTTRMIVYTETLEQKGNHLLIIWPEHCLIGTPGHNVHPDLMDAFLNWERKEFANVNYITKGTNPFTEHYGGLQAEVPDPNDPSTQLNTTLITALQNADIVFIAGEASSHCVRATVQQLVDNIGDAHLRKLHLIVDCMSPVAAQPGTPDFPAIAEQFLQDMKSRGLHLTKSTDFLA